MKDDPDYLVALFETVSYVMKAEKILKEAGVPHKIIPVPRHISSDCGVCIRFLPEHKETIVGILSSAVHVGEIRQLKP
jgi:hypothetical protein